MEHQKDFTVLRSPLQNLTEEELEARFWELAEKIVTPLLELAQHHTSPAIERSVLLRMGFSSAEAAQVVEGCLNQGLLGKGAGHVVLKVAKDGNLPLREAGLALMEGRLWDRALTLFNKTTPKKQENRQ